MFFGRCTRCGFYDWLKTLKPEDVALPDNLTKGPKPYFSPGSHQYPMPGTADRIMHDFSAHKNPKALNAAIAEMLEGDRLVGPMDHDARPQPGL